MRIDVIGRGIEVTDAIRQYAENKASKLPKYYDGLQQVTVSLTRKNAHHTPAAKTSTPRLISSPRRASVNSATSRSG
jgi:ribosomal subunit interface protein